MILDVKKNIFFGILLSLITFLFIFIPGVKASGYNNADNIVSFNSDDSGFLNLNLKNEDIEEYISTLNLDSSLDGYIFFVYPVYDRFEFKLFIFSKTIAEDKSLMIRGGNSGANIGSKIVSYGSTPFTGYYISNSDVIYRSKQKDYKTFNDFVFSKSISSFTNGNAVYLNSNTNTINKPIYYYSNVDIYNEYTSQNIESSKPQSYTFNEDIDVTNISKVKVKFDLPSDTKNLNLSLNYSITGMNIFGTIGQPYIALKSINEDGKEQTDISNTDRVDYDTLVANACVIADCDQYKDWKTNPFEEMLDGITEDKVNNFLNSHVTDVSKWDSFREITNKIIHRQYNYATHYVDDFNMTLLPDSTVNGYSLEFDTFNYNGSLHLNFTSNLNYTIEYEYMSENEDYFTTINMKDYAALIMIPKVYDRNNEIQSSISSDIYLSGKYDIELWESIESKNVLYRKSNYEDIVFSHYQHRLYPNAVLYFIKKPVDNSTMDLYIKFDSRYYSYVTKTNLAEEVVINNPNTGEDITIGDISNLFDSNLENDDFSILDYLDDIRDTADYFDYYFNKGWKLLPFRIRAIILFIFNIMCVAIVLKIGGYKK